MAGLPDGAGQARALADALDAGAADLPRVHALVDEALERIQPLLDADTPFDPDAPVDAHGPVGIAALMRALVAVRLLAERLAGRPLDRSLPAPLRVRPEVPVRGHGPVSVVQVADLGHPGGATGRLDGWRVLAEAGLRDRVTWRTVHAPDAFLGPVGPRAAHLAEAVARVAPHRFDDAMDPSPAPTSSPTRPRSSASPASTTSTSTPSSPRPPPRGPRRRHPRPAPRTRRRRPARAAPLRRRTAARRRPRALQELLRLVGEAEPG
ncbi:MAG: hypothetical protein R3F59_05180 [Myxococcota bacterium]